VNDDMEWLVVKILMCDILLRSDSTIYKIQDDQKVSAHLTITIQKVTSNVQSVPRQSPDIY
jgi:hypothetical protein